MPPKGKSKALLEASSPELPSMSSGAATSSPVPAPASSDLASNGNGKVKETGNVTYAEATASGSGLSLEEKLRSLRTAAPGSGFLEDDSDEELEVDIKTEAFNHVRYTTILLLPVALSLEVASASHVMPVDYISDHSFAIRIALRIDAKLSLGPGLWRLHASLVHKRGVRKVVEATVARCAVTDGSSFELLLSRLAAGLRAFAKEEGKRVKATATHLVDVVASPRQAMMRDPTCKQTSKRLAVKEAQLREYHASRKDKLHPMSGMRLELRGEVASQHLTTMVQARKACTQIAELQTADGVVSDSQGILRAASDFFADIFGRDLCQLEERWRPDKDKTLRAWEVAELSADWTEEEVKHAFSAMAANKSPGKDGLPKELFEAHWDLLGKGFMALAKDFARTAVLSREVKEAVTILLHKKGDKDQLNNYCPITLLNFTYKVLARVMADRMKKYLGRVISPEQYGFLPGRRLTDAVGLVADIIDSARNDNEKWFLLLVDFKKAFDFVSRGYLFRTMRAMGFPDRFVRWAEGLHEGTQTRLLVNGWMGEGVEVISGVRQGCPLAPYLFLCAVEPLAQTVLRKKMGISKEASERLAYIGYADDTTLVLEGKHQLIKAEKVLAKFELTSGLATNRDKSVVLPLGNNLGRTTGRSHSFRRAKKDEAEKLLGVWITPSGSCLPTWEKTSEDISRKVKKWEQTYLPTTARTAVVNSYTMPKAAFQAQVYPPPAKQWGVISKTFENFVSGNKATADRVFRLWSKVLLYTPRKLGGVGVQDPEMILACLTARRVGLLALETNQLKKHLMVRAADLPMGIETFFAHEKLLKHWEGKSARWKVARENFMKTPLGTLPEVATREAVAWERIVFNKRLLLNGTTPVGGHQDAKLLWERRLGDLVELGGSGVPELKDSVTQEKELGGKGAAKLARRAFEAAPQKWKELLLSASPQPSNSTGDRRALHPAGRKLSDFPIFENGGIAPLRRLKLLWKEGQKPSAKQQLWNGRWSGSINWKKTIAIRDSLVTPSKPRDVMLRIHNLNLQVGERVAFFSSKPVCPYCGGEETLEHCLYSCPKIQVVTSALVKSLRMLNSSRAVSSLGDLLFREAGTITAFPEATLTSITLYQLWAERCDAVFRGKKFRTRRVLRRVEAAFRLHAHIYTRSRDAEWKKRRGTQHEGKFRRVLESENKLLFRIRDKNSKSWTWTKAFSNVWLAPRMTRQPP
ncbi:unnamed protein product [Closterium sp. NIES-65]|nr:unnamed protein product [Closterium sp. NIES-65]